MPEAGSVSESGECLDASPVLRDRPRPNRMVLALAILALIGHLVGLYTPGSPEPGFEIAWLPNADKVAHVLLFGVPVYLFGLLSRRAGLIAGLFAVQAVLSELIQWRFIPYREGDPLDALADFIGVGLATLVLVRTKAGHAD